MSHFSWWRKVTVFSSNDTLMLESGQEQQDRKTSLTSFFSRSKYILFIFGSSGGVKFQLGWIRKWLPTTSEHSQENEKNVLRLVFFGDWWLSHTRALLVPSSTCAEHHVLPTNSRWLVSQSNQFYNFVFKMQIETITTDEKHSCGFLVCFHFLIIQTFSFHVNEMRWWQKKDKLVAGSFCIFTQSLSQ